MAFVPLLQAYRAELALAEGSISDALNYGEAACALGEKTRQRMSLGEAQRVLGKVYTYMEMWEKAEQAIKTSLEIQRECNALPLVAYSLFEMAQFDQKRREFDQSGRWNTQAIALFEQLGMALHLDRARQLNSDLSQSV